MSADYDDMGKKKNDGGGPGWLMTFADLMSLLLTFFVLLLSFAELDVKKYKQLVGSVKMAFGVQKEFVFEEIPMGKDIIKEEFSSGPPDFVPQETVTQTFTIEVPEFEELEEQKRKELEKEKKKAVAELKKQVDKARAQLANEIESQDVEIDWQKDRAIIRIREDISFASGSVDLQRSLGPVLLKVAKFLKKTSGTIRVAGHTDDRPISTSRFRSNWELSTSRAVTLGHTLLKIGNIPEQRLVVEGHAATKPLVPNTSQENRARNRRVEIMVEANVRLPATDLQ